jgi:hypothetical protein
MTQKERIGVRKSQSLSKRDTKQKPEKRKRETNKRKRPTHTKNTKETERGKVGIREIRQSTITITNAITNTTAHPPSRRPETKPKTQTKK